ncbi:Inner membrane protein YeeA [Sodalis glossinidius str. 'morsitans']|uniref:Inner membrane protein YeeA n=1 Tax=Sodalis glossinidius (strain morsitans) TaxID=343509 RepID=A0A193QIP2_SODGM|nr:Inner membrane protein YeeA [Sodalis glossinidius str. 'morsitans']
MFFSGYLTLGKRSYMALLIGITMAVVCGAGAGDMRTALWRSGDVVIGSLLALLFTSIYPQRAFIHWRMQMRFSLLAISKIYAAYISPNIIERPRLEGLLKTVLNDVVKIRALLTPASKETGLPKPVMESIQTLSCNMVCVLEMQIEAWWASRASHFLLLNATSLRSTQIRTLRTLATLAEALREGNPEPIVANSWSSWRNCCVSRFAGRCHKRRRARVGARGVIRRPRSCAQIFAVAKKRVEWGHAKVVHSCYSVSTQHCKEFNVSAKQGN